MKILVLFVGKCISQNELKIMCKANSMLLKPLRKSGHKIDLCDVLSEPDHGNKYMMGSFKYSFVCKEMQYTKMCIALNNIKEEYDWYIKTRPDLNFNESFTMDLLYSCDKNKINTRIRNYFGPSINIKNGTSLQNDWLKRRGEAPTLSKKILINPDDMFYIFHKTIVKKAFSPPFNQNWNCHKQHESYHRLAWSSRGIEINPIGIDVNVRTMRSGDLTTADHYKKSENNDDNNNGKGKNENN